jgi:hypothetical protein
MNHGNRVLMFGVGWLALISGLHACLNVHWSSLLNDWVAEDKRRLNVAYIPVT